MPKLTTIILLFLSSLLYAQDSTKLEVLRPLLLDKAVLSGIGLQPIQLKDTPERKFFQKQLYRGKEISIYVVSSESWTVPFEQFWFDEFIYILNGEAKVQSEKGEHKFQTGEYFFAPKGFKGAWEVVAGDQLHYELSVITNQRADSTQVSTYDFPQVLDKTKLSGLDIVFDDQGLYEENLFAGVELTIKVKAEKPRSADLAQAQKEKLIGLLSGQITIEDQTGENHVFYTGDYFVLPHNFRGKWTSQGHGMVKYITVEKT